MEPEVGYEPTSPSGARVLTVCVCIAPLGHVSEKGGVEPPRLLRSSGFKPGAVAHRLALP